MTLLTICQNVADNIPIKAPSTIINNTNKDAKLLLSCAQKASKWLSKQPEDGWAVMQAEHTFNTAASTDSYALPIDYGSILNETVWDRANYWQFRGPLSPAQWQEYKSSIIGTTNTLRKRFRIKGTSGSKLFFIDPTPTAIEACVFEYITNTWCESSGGAAQSSWAADDDVAMIDEDLIELETQWRMLKRIGFDYAEEKKEARDQLRLEMARDGGAKTLNIGAGEGVSLITTANVPDSGFG